MQGGREIEAQHSLFKHVPQVTAHKLITATPYLNYSTNNPDTLEWQGGTLPT